MAEQTQVQQVSTKDPKKVEQGKRLSESNHRKREERERLAKAQSESKLGQYYGHSSHCSHWCIRCSQLLH